MTRLSFLESVVATAPFVLGGCVAGSGALAARKKIRLAVQMYTLRALPAKDLGNTFERIRQLGLDGVELWDPAGYSAKDVRHFADLNGLGVCGTHLSLDKIEGPRLNETLDYANEVGNRNLIVPWMPPPKGELDLRGWWLKQADLFNRVAELAGKRGCCVGYHNHLHEFQKRIDGVTHWEFFLNALSKDVVIQLDVGSVIEAGQDPVYWYRRYPGRSPTLHFREAPDSEHGYFGVVGDPAPGKDPVDWKALFGAIREDPVTEWGILEPTTNNTLGTTCRSLMALRKMGVV